MPLMSLGLVFEVPDLEMCLLKESQFFKKIAS